RLVLRAQILDHRVRMQHVAADLRAEARVDMVAAQLSHFALPLLELHLDQAALEQSHRVLPILQLRALSLSGDDDACRLVAQAHRRTDLVDVLAAWTTRAIGLELNVFVAYVDGRRLTNIRHDFDTRKRSLAPVRLIERRKSHQAMIATLALQVAVGVLPPKGNRHRLVTG